MSCVPSIGVWVGGGVLPADLAEEQVELLARAMVSSLGQEELDLLLNLLFIQMPAVLIVDAGSRRGVRGPYSHTFMERYMCIRSDAPFFQDACADALRIKQNSSRCCSLLCISALIGTKQNSNAH